MAIIYEDAAKKANLKHREQRDYRCCWPHCKSERTGVTMGYGLCDKHDAGVYRIQEKMQEKEQEKMTEIVKPIDTNILESALPEQPKPFSIEGFLDEGNR